jgi:metaxin
VQLLAHPEPTTLASLLAPPDAPPSSELDHALPTPAVPLFGFSSVLYSTRTRADPAQVAAEYADAVAALSERLGADAWLLGSPAPTFLDALAFAHVHAALASTDAVRAEVTRRVNLVAWERKVASAVRAAFRRQEEHGVA